MPLPTCLQYGVGGTITYRAATTRATAARVRILSGSGTEILPSTAATVSTIDAELSAAVSRGDWSVSVNSNVGFSQGETFHITDDQEELLIKSVAGTTISLRRPAMKSHVSGADTEGTTITYAVNSSTAGTLFWDGHAEWNIDGSVFDKTAVCCTKYPMWAVYPTDQDLLDVVPLLQREAPDEVDMERLRRLGADRTMAFIASIAPDLRAETFAGSDSFKHASCLFAAMIYFMSQRGDENRELYERYKKEAEEEVNRMVLVSPRDADGDGTVEEDERISGYSIRINA